MNRTFAALTGAAAAMLFACAPAQAELERFAELVCGENKICFHVWPKLPAVPGWHTDEATNYKRDVNTLVPDGFTFGDAETVIYSNAIFKEDYGKDNPGANTLEGFIENDKKGFIESNPSPEISEIEPFTTGDGEKLRTFSFKGVNKNNDEIVVYGEEHGYYTVFVISSRSKAGLENGLATFKDLMSRYKVGADNDPNNYTIVKPGSE